MTASSRPLPDLPSEGGSYDLDIDAWAWVRRDESSSPEQPAPAITTTIPED